LLSDVCKFYVTTNRTATPYEKMGHNNLVIEKYVLSRYYIVIDWPTVFVEYDFALRFCYGTCSDPCYYDPLTLKVCSGNGACNIDSGQCVCDSGTEKLGEYDITGAICSQLVEKPGFIWMYALCLLTPIVLFASLMLCAYLFIETDKCAWYQDILNEDNSLLEPIDEEREEI